MTRFAWGAATDTGRVRQANEDSLLAVDGLFAVADGMGGHKAGEVASRLAVETLQEEFDAAGTDVLVGAVQNANDVLVERSSDDAELTGMGTTLCAMALVDADGRDAMAVVNVGDSRLYLLSEGELTQITEDHSLVATLERQGRLSRAEAAVHPQRNILTRALGIDARVMVDSWEILPVVGDRYLICSDGLFNEVDDNRMAATLRRLADPAEAAKELVRLANEAGGRDNITCRRGRRGRRHRATRRPRPRRPASPSTTSCPIPPSPVPTVPTPPTTAAARAAGDPSAEQRRGTHQPPGPPAQRSAAPAHVAGWPVRVGLRRHHRCGRRDHRLHRARTRTTSASTARRSRSSRAARRCAVDRPPDPRAPRSRVDEVPEAPVDEVDAGVEQHLARRGPAVRREPPGPDRPGHDHHDVDDHQHDRRRATVSTPRPTVAAG